MGAHGCLPALPQVIYSILPGCLSLVESLLEALLALQVPAPDLLSAERMHDKGVLNKLSLETASRACGLEALR